MSEVGWLTHQFVTMFRFQKPTVRYVFLEISIENGLISCVLGVIVPRIIDETSAEKLAHYVNRDDDDDYD